MCVCMTNLVGILVSKDIGQILLSLLLYNLVLLKASFLFLINFHIIELHLYYWQSLVLPLQVILLLKIKKRKRKKGKIEISAFIQMNCQYCK